MTTNTITSHQDVCENLQPVVCGADVLGYSYARSFWENYGIKTIVLASAEVKFLSTSRFVDYRVIDGIDNEDVLLDILEQIACEHKDKTMLLLGSGDWYARIFSQNKERLEAHYTVPYIDFDLLDTITQKENFYNICEEIGIAYPTTWVYDCSDTALSIPVDTFTYPVIAKPSNSARYHYAEFPGKKKIFYVETPEELASIFKHLQASVYDRELIVQDCVPGGDSALRSITCYTDENAQLVAAVLGQVVLEDHAPSAIGNPVCIMGLDDDQGLIGEAARFLQHVGYHGFANFDVKYDERDGSYRFFEVNTRPGRNSYYMTLAGIDFVGLLVDDWIKSTPITPAPAPKPFLFTVIPPAVIKKYVEEPLASKVLAFYKNDTKGCPFFCKKDTKTQSFWAHITYYNQIRKFKRYLGDVR